MNLKHPPIGATILLAEDENQLRDLFTLVLNNEGYRVLPARDGEHALRIAASYADEIHLLLSDVMMPEVTGPSLARELRTVRPNVPVILMSGYTPGSIALDEDWVFLTKPVCVKALLRETATQIGRNSKSRNGTA